MRSSANGRGSARGIGAPASGPRPTWLNRAARIVMYILIGFSLVGISGSSSHNQSGPPPILRYTFGPTALTANATASSPAPVLWNPIPVTWFSNSNWNWSSCSASLAGLFKQQISIHVPNDFKVTIPSPGPGIWRISVYLSGCGGKHRVFNMRLFDVRGAQLNFWPPQNPFDEFPITSGVIETAFYTIGNGSFVLEIQPVAGATDTPLIAAISIAPVCVGTCLSTIE